MDIKIGLSEGMLDIPKGAKGIVLFAHGSGSSRFSKRNNFVAKALREKGLGTLLIDLLSKEEDAIYETRFDIELLTERLMAIILWLKKEHALSIGLFGSSTGAASALNAASGESAIKAVVSRGGRPDLASKALPKVRCPTLLIVGDQDFGVIELNQEAFQALTCEKELVLVPGATHLFEEPGCLDEVARLAAEWFLRFLVT